MWLVFCKYGAKMIPATINLPDTLATYYTTLSRENGKTVDELIVRDLEEYAESKRFYANEREKVHP